ncbi:hypothetical protein CTRI78_v010643 [Colletotrichum trifolii]|uniref:BZIP domain-containing protein n=1 Tax=Colletotrichum trifolii TaxID=5466 RepID=A0A4R8QJQ0_COLTR|nr:hypothetical protein CTRI78_v010643 [Colletotrichum trifolii]
MPAAACSAAAACRQTARFCQRHKQPAEASFAILDLEYQHEPQLQLQFGSHLSAAGLPGTDLGLFGPDSVLDDDPSLSSFLDPSSSWDSLPWTSAAPAASHVSASPLDNLMDQSFPYMDTSPPTNLFDTFPDSLVPRLDPAFGSSDSSNTNSPNQVPLDMSVYAAASAAAAAATSAAAAPPPSHRSSPTSDGPGPDISTPGADKILRRQRNTIAARKYRQKKVDRIADLEKLLEDMTRDRDDLRLRLARQEAETDALKSIMRKETKQ